MAGRIRPTLLLVLAACTASPFVRAADLPVIELTLQNGHFVPATLKVPAHRKFKLRVINRGPAVEEFESSDLNREQIVVPGRSIIVYLGPLEPGRYRFFGDFHPSTAQGVMISEDGKP